MNIGGLGLGPSDGTCYDPNHPWYMPNLWNTEAECVCMGLHPDEYTCGQQCVGYGPPGCTAVGVALAPAGTVLAEGANAIGQGIGTGVASGVSNFASSVDLSGLMLLGIVGAAIYMLKR